MSAKKLEVAMSISPSEIELDSIRGDCNKFVSAILTPLGSLESVAARVVGAMGLFFTKWFVFPEISTLGTVEGGGQV